MKTDWPKMRRASSAVLACALVLGSVLSGLPAGSPVALAQSTAPTASKMVVVGGDGAMLYTAPQGEEVINLPLGSVLTATRRTADAQWIAVTADDGVSGWVRAGDIVAFGLDKLPVEGDTATATGASTNVTTPAATKAPPTKAPTQAPTATPTREPTPTPEPTATPLPTATPEIGRASCRERV